MVLAGFGAIFGAKAFSDKSTAENACGATFCTPAGTDATSSMKTDETLSTLGVIAGLAAVGAGAYLVVSSSGETPAVAGTVRVSLDLAPAASGVRSPGESAALSDAAQCIGQAAGGSVGSVAAHSSVTPQLKYGLLVPQRSPATEHGAPASGQGTPASSVRPPASGKLV